ncbi:MAG: hypothetical protein Q7S33_02660 [Nanoarchaeota archaeon]|nr:hypothetical protein [Nanoarchaeota archaeon]
MAWFGNKEKVPELPQATSLPELPKREVQELPSFPNNEMGNRMNNFMVKSAVDDSFGEKEGDDYLEELPKDFNFDNSGEAELPETSEDAWGKVQPTSSFQIPSYQDYQQKYQTSQPSQQVQQPSKTEPVFVRIDKFQAAQKDFYEIKKKILEVENILNKVKDVKSKENQELNEWGNDLDKIKSRLVEIESTIFNQI